MKTLLISSVFPPQDGGSGRWFWEIYRRLPRSEYHVVTGTHPRAAEFDATHDLNLTRIPFSLSTWGTSSVAGLGGYWRLWKHIRQIVRQHSIERIHCGACLPDGWIAFLCRRFLKIPYVCYMHGEELCYAGASRELGWMSRRVLGNADFIIANSINTENILRDRWGVPPSQIRRLSPGVDTRWFCPAPRNPGVRETLGWGERLVILTVGRLQKRKGHEQFIRALPAISRHFPRVLYVIAGQGEQYTALQSLVDELDLRQFVRFMGSVSEECLLQCYQQCDLFVLPNRQIGYDVEGFGMVLIEAQACSRAVIAGVTGGTTETMQVPQTGLLIDPDDSNEMVETIIKLLDEPRELHRMGEAGRRWVKEQFDWEQLARQAYATFENIAPEGSPVLVNG